jgi:GT2 family glycosyltransferase
MWLSVIEEKSMQDYVFIFSVYKNDTPENVATMLNSIKMYERICVIDGEIDSALGQVIDEHDMVVVRNEENRGLPNCMNQAISIGMAEGYDFFFRIDADDRNHHDRVGKTLNLFDQKPSLLFGGTFCYEIDEKGEIVFEKSLPHTDHEMKQVLLKRPPFIHPTVCFRRDFFDEVGTYNESLRIAQDYELWFRAAARGIEFANVPEFLYYYRKDSDFYRKYRSKERASGELRIHREGLRLIEAPRGANVYPWLKYALRRSPTFISRLAYTYMR